MRQLHQAHRPGKQERHLDVENDEQDRHQIEADIEFHPRIFEGRETAFVGRQLFGVGRLGRQNHGRDHENNSERKRDAHEYRNGQVLKEERVHGLFRAKSRRLLDHTGGAFQHFPGGAPIRIVM